MSIAMGYLRGTGLVDEVSNAEMLVATAIFDAWKRGERHPIRLANEGIVSAERTADKGQLPDLFKMLV
jgi:hypothetical protein